MSVRTRFIIVAAGFIVASSLILYVYFQMTAFWLLIPGVAGVAVFGPWSYYLYAKLKEPTRPTHDEIVTTARMEMKTKEKKL